ncbi:MAG: hypothetical protein E6540_06030 [Enterococcus sp.]|uniref:Uncharacterized protein n=1 Tax=Enterococcus devriesei TaxID=319970 RepID=A0A1L8SYD8_9ENTE|nr:hypothetical protein [Enterococcus sp.]OJG36978.1 hypothetical protein RV00_GL001423 [Enterococcus devriesei]
MRKYNESIILTKVFKLAKVGGDLDEALILYRTAKESNHAG